MNVEHVFVGFGFGPIQAGFFVHEAVKSDNFSRGELKGSEGN